MSSMNCKDDSPWVQVLAGRLHETAFLPSYSLVQTSTRSGIRRAKSCRRCRHRDLEIFLQMFSASWKGGSRNSQDQKLGLRQEGDQELQMASQHAAILPTRQ